jgi:hypothetical protein
VEVVGPILARRAVDAEGGAAALGMLRWFSATEITISEVDGENRTSQIGC